MVFLNQREQKIVRIFLERGPLRSAEIHEALLGLGETLSQVTVKRTLSVMAGDGVLRVTGSGRSTKYEVNTVGRLFADIDAHVYCAIEPDKRYGLRTYNFAVLPETPIGVFSEQELLHIDEGTILYAKNRKDISATIQKKELERLVIELSWKSSKIEGNTYTLLDTEKLILENKEASGHAAEEARMILNHKDAFYFILQNATEFATVTRRNIELLHTILVKDLDVGSGFRKTPVGVLGSVYRPLDNVHQITDAMDALGATVSRMKTPYDKALMALLGTSYVQPFEDGNKRTARLLANAVLLAHGCAPLSYRSVDEEQYRDATLVFYEINSLVPFKKIFIEQYDFAARNYVVGSR